MALFAALFWALFLAIIGLAALWVSKRYNEPFSFIKKGRVAAADTPFVSARSEGSGIIDVHFKKLTGVSAIHVHQSTPHGTIGPIISWLATSKKWQDTQGAADNNSPCCKNATCSRRAPPGTPLVSALGAHGRYHVPWSAGTSHGKFQLEQAPCGALAKFDNNDVFLVVHGMGVSPTNLDILAHSKFALSSP
jgi:hypothetical protein